MRAGSGAVVIASGVVAGVAVAIVAAVVVVDVEGVAIAPLASLYSRDHGGCVGDY